MKPYVLIAEDEKAVSELLLYNLRKEDFDVGVAGDGEETLIMLDERTPDLLLLDWMLPKVSGIEICRRVRTGGGNPNLPIIMLTARGEESDRIRGLDTGADDYVTKPFRFPVLLARIRAQLRQHEQSEDAVFQLGPYTFKPAMKLLETEDAKKIRLTEKETNILKYLYRAQDGVVAREVLLHEVWGYNAGVTTHTLETHIYRLRQKIEPDPANVRLLVTESGGYRLVA